MLQGLLGMLQFFIVSFAVWTAFPHMSHICSPGSWISLIEFGQFAVPLALQIQTSLPKWLRFILKSFYFQSSSYPYILYLLYPIHLDSSNILERQAKFSVMSGYPIRKLDTSTFKSLSCKVCFQIFSKSLSWNQLYKNLKKGKTIHFAHTLSRSSLLLSLLKNVT